MRKIYVLVVSLFLCGSLAAADTNRAGRIERRLDSLAASFAKALEDRGFREAVQRSIASSETGEVRLRDLLDREVAAGSAVARRLAERWGSAGAKVLANVDVSVQPGLEAWDLAVAPLVTYTWEGGARENVRAFEASGAALTLDPRQPLPRATIVLEVHDTRNAVEVMSRPVAPDAGAAGPSGIPEKLFTECTESATYSSYPLITNAAIWDAHEGCCNGPKGFLYFSAAGSEKTGNLPVSLGGRTGWSTNVWASNFQGPVPEGGNARVQWEWTADGWLEQSPYRTYPAVYCRQSASSTAGFSLAAYTIREDDEWPNSDDYVGQVQIDHRYCKSDVFDLGIENGWSSQHTTFGVDDVISTTYELYCSTTRRCFASTQCPDGRQISCSGSGTCNGNCFAGEGWVQCGSTYRDCSETTCPNGQIICDPAEPM